MFIQKVWKNYRVTVRIQFGLDAVRRVYGIHSNLENKRHILLWDFDDVPLEQVELSLHAVRERFGLRVITIVQTNNTDSFHAICLDEKYYAEAAAILAFTGNIDNRWYVNGRQRGYWTLRIPDDTDSFHVVSVLGGLQDKALWTHYWEHLKLGEWYRPLKDN